MKRKTLGDGFAVVASRGLSARQRVAAIAATLLLLTSYGAYAPGAPADAADYPGASEVARAKAAAADAASSVAQLDAAIVQLNEALYLADVARRTAEEEYSEAQWANVEAQRQLFAANNRADEADKGLDAARGRLAVLAMAAYRDGNALGSLEALVSAEGFEDVVARVEAQDRASTDAQVVVEQVRAADLVAQIMREYAQGAADAASSAEAVARDAYQAAQAIYAASKVAVAEAEATRVDLISKLASLRKTSVELEQQRQAGLEDERIARELAAAQARIQAADEAALREQEDARKAAEAAAEAALREQEEERKAAEAAAEAAQNPPPEPEPDPTSGTEPATEPEPAPEPEPDPDPEQAPAPAPSPTSTSLASRGNPTSDSVPIRATWAQANLAADFAYAQNGKKYQSGATGPDAYDCSGLTSTAWAYAGVSIPRTSRTQYPAVAHVSYASRARGDLMFWGTNANPNYMYHVAMYLGGNQIIEGGSPSSGIHTRDWRNWHLGDLMPYMGRV